MRESSEASSSWHANIIIQFLAEKGLKCWLVPLSATSVQNWRAYSATYQWPCRTDIKHSPTLFPSGAWSNAHQNNLAKNVTESPPFYCGPSENFAC